MRIVKLCLRRVQFRRGHLEEEVMVEVIALLSFRVMLML